MGDFTRFYPFSRIPIWSNDNPFLHIFVAETLPSLRLLQYVLPSDTRHRIGSPSRLTVLNTQLTHKTKPPSHNLTYKPPSVEDPRYKDRDKRIHLNPPGASKTAG